MSETRSAAPGMLRIPNNFARTLLVRGVVVWVLARVMVWMLYRLMSASYGETAEMFTQSNPLLLAVWTVVLSIALARLDLHRRHEISLLNNLGVVTSHAMMLVTVPSVVIESIGMVLR